MEHFEKSDCSRLTFPALQILRAGMTKRKWIKQAMEFPEFSGFDDVDDLADRFEQMDIVIGGRLREESRHGNNLSFSDRLVGVITGKSLELGKRARRLVFPDILEIQSVATDWEYRGGAEWWLMDQLEAEIKSVQKLQRFTHVAIRSALYDPDDAQAIFARNHGFVTKDIHRNQVIWQWPEHDDGILAEHSSGER
jgi:hypothetical protein